MGDALLTGVGDKLRLKPFPTVEVRIVKDRGDVWEVEPLSELAAIGMKMGARMAGGSVDPCIAKDDPLWELAP